MLVQSRFVTFNTTNNQVHAKNAMALRILFCLHAHGILHLHGPSKVHSCTAAAPGSGGVVDHSEDGKDGNDETPRTVAKALDRLRAWPYEALW